MRMVEEPVSANFTGTVSPTTRWSELAVVVSMSRSPAAAARVLPAVMSRMTVWDRLFVSAASSDTSDCRTSNWPL